MKNPANQIQINRAVMNDTTDAQLEARGYTAEDIAQVHAARADVEAFMALPASERFAPPPRGSNLLPSQLFLDSLDSD